MAHGVCESESRLPSASRNDATPPPGDGFQTPSESCAIPGTRSRDTGSGQGTNRGVDVVDGIGRLGPHSGPPTSRSASRSETGYLASFRGGEQVTYPRALNPRTRNRLIGVS